MLNESYSLTIRHVLNKWKKGTICDAKLLDVGWMDSMKGDKHLKLLGKL